MNSNQPEVERIVERALARHGRRPEALIAVLQTVNDSLGFIPREALFDIARRISVPPSRAYHVATFYNAFSLEPRGRYLIEVCAGTACHVTGAMNLLESLERQLGVPCGGTTRDNLFTLTKVRCLGCCSLAPVVRIGGNIHAFLSQEDIPGILRHYGKGDQPGEEGERRDETLC